jgi:hypothetical protein
MGLISLAQSAKGGKFASNTPPEFPGVGTRDVTIKTFSLFLFLREIKFYFFCNLVINKYLFIKMFGIHLTLHLWATSFS